MIPSLLIYDTHPIQSNDMTQPDGCEAYTQSQMANGKHTKHGRNGKWRMANGHKLTNSPLISSDSNTIHNPDPNPIFTWSYSRLI